MKTFRLEFFPGRHHFGIVSPELPSELQTLSGQSERQISA
jgi:hypothetical protein